MTERGNPADSEHGAGQPGDEIEPGEVRASGAPRLRGIYLAPNLITTGALFAGFYAIVAGMNGNFIGAALAIYVAMLLDTLDGRVARWTRTESRFGAEYDSLSDMVAFGVAPALVAFSWGLDTLGKLGWFCTFVYMACAALRLARFNTQSDLASFTGLASPSAAAIIASAIWVSSEAQPTTDPGALHALVLGALTLGVGLLMVSSFRYFSPKAFDLKGRVPFVTMVGIAMILAVTVADPPRVLLLLSLVYA
ncbi:MAG: CDP-diacylglycerol--serine O-phosphatidyltransferase, partial [Gammaproteobacteria bacterium]